MISPVGCAWWSSSGLCPWRRRPRLHLRFFIRPLLRPRLRLCLSLCRALAGPLAVAAMLWVPEILPLNLVWEPAAGEESFCLSEFLILVILEELPSCGDRLCWSYSSAPLDGVVLGDLLLDFFLVHFATIVVELREATAHS